MLRGPQLARKSGSGAIGYRDDAEEAEESDQEDEVNNAAGATAALEASGHVVD